MDSNAARPISPLRQRMLDDMRARKLARFALHDVCHDAKIGPNQRLPSRSRPGARPMLSAPDAVHRDAGNVVHP